MVEESFLQVEGASWGQGAFLPMREAIRMKKQKGQAIVEFALILPLFLMLMFGVVYSGMLFADYMTLSNVARASAREAALGTDITTVKSYYQGHTTLWTSLYTWQPSNSNDYDIQTVTESTEDGGSIKAIRVTIRTTLNNSAPALGFVSGFLPNQYTIEYYMNNETS